MHRSYNGAEISCITRTHRRKLGKNIGKARVRALWDWGLAVQPRAQPTAVLGWAWKRSGLGSVSLSRLSRVANADCRVVED